MKNGWLLRIFGSLIYHAIPFPLSMAWIFSVVCQRIETNNLSPESLLAVGVLTAISHEILITSVD